MLSSLIERINENRVWFPLIGCLLFFSTCGVVNCIDKRRQKARAKAHFLPACQKKHSAAKCYELFERNHEECIFWNYHKRRYSGSYIDFGRYEQCAYDPKAWKEARKKRRKRR